MNRLTLLAELSNGDIISGSLDGSIKIWDLKAQKLISKFNCHSGSITCISELNSDLILSTSNDCSMKIWKIDNLKKKNKNLNDSLIAKFCFTSSISFDSPKTFCWTFISSEILQNKKEELSITVPRTLSSHEPSEHNVFVTCASSGCVDDIENRIFGFSNGFINIMQPSSVNGILKKFIYGHSGAITFIRQSKTGIVISVAVDNTIKLWETKSLKWIATFNEHENNITCLNELNSGEIITGSENGLIKIWDLKLKTSSTLINDNDNRIKNIAELNTGDILCAFSDGSIKNLNIESHKYSATLIGAYDKVDRVFILKNGDVITEFSDDTLKFWNYTTKKYFPLTGYAGKRIKKQCVLI